MAQAALFKRHTMPALALWPLTAAVVALLALGAGLGYGAWSKSHRFIGTDLGRSIAPGFTLTDQDGRRVSLSDFRGKPVALTFLYSHCPDTCPLIARKLGWALDQMGADAGRVAVVAVSTDPVHDNRASVQSFLQRYGVAGRMEYLTGSPARLQPVWQGYHIAAEELPADTPGGSVLHTAGINVIDQQGRERVYLDGESFLPADLVHDWSLLL
ncbi:MAG: SCO family protein [Chloroflexota bacterium]